jgi:hypothetical protein
LDFSPGCKCILPIGGQCDITGSGLEPFGDLLGNIGGLPGNTLGLPADSGDIISSLFEGHCTDSFLIPDGVTKCAGLSRAESEVPGFHFADIVACIRGFGDRK